MVASVNGVQATAQAQPDGHMVTATIEGRSARGMDDTRALMTEAGGACASGQWVSSGPCGKTLISSWSYRLNRFPASKLAGMKSLCLTSCGEV